MVPLKTTQGHCAEEIRALLGGRDMYVWGGGPLARDVLTSLRKSGIEPKAFVTNRSNDKSAISYGLEVVNVDAVLKDYTDSLIVIASESYLQQADKICQQSGLIKGRDFINFFSIQRPVAVVDVSGICDLECVNCPQGNMVGALSTGVMTFNNYRDVFDKLQQDIPLLCKVELSAWGEPFLNQDLAKIVEYTERGVPCSISTNLIHVENLKEVLSANPSELNITIQGHEGAYEQVMCGTSWSRLLSNLEQFSEVIGQIRPDTRVAIKAYEYKIGSDGFKDSLLALGEQYAIDVEFCSPYPASYDLILDYADGSPVNAGFAFSKDMLVWDLDYALALSRKEANKPCLSQRIFPIINWDMSVSLCHTYCTPRVAKNYLEHSWEELLSLRHNSRHCQVCQEHALHRLDLQVLARHYPDKVTKLFR